jgi:hypothetical protein
MGGRPERPGGPLAVAPASPTVVVADGVVYVAGAGKIVAFEAKTLRKLATAVYEEPPLRGGPRHPQGPAPGQPQAPPDKAAAAE